MSTSVQWPSFGYNVAGTRHNPKEKTLKPANVGTMAVDWSYTTGSYVQSSPAVVDGVVYIGSNDGNLYAFEASTGALLWSYYAGYYGDIISSPAVANGVVYVGSNDKMMYALNASTGALLWSYTAGSYVLNSPLVANGIVYDASYSDDKLFALNANTGKLLWSYAVGGPYLDNSPALANGMLYIGANDHKVYAFALPQPMKVSPGILNFSAQAGGSNPPGQTVTLSNSGTSTFTWSAGSPSQPWLTVTPTSGSLAAGMSTYLTFTVNINGLSAGTYSASVVLTSSIGSPITVVVRLTLT